MIPTRQTINADRALAERLFTELREMSLDEPGVTRDAYGEGEERAHRLVRTCGAELGLSAETDAAGNLYVTLAGAQPELPGWYIGSHLDTVPHGGNYDGAAGILAGLAAVSGLQTVGMTPHRSVTVVVIRAEESTWFPASYIGSRAAFGLLPPDVLELKRADTGRSLADHMRDLCLSPDRLASGEKHLSADRIHGFVELHIEQGPTLEIAGCPIGLVTSIAGSFRYRDALCIGSYGHSGAVQRRHRQDAVMAAAELAMTLDRLWVELDEAGESATITFGQFSTDAEQHAFSKVPGKVRFSLDVRSEHIAVLDRIHGCLLAEAEGIASRRNIRFRLGDKTGSTPTLLDRPLRAKLGALAEEAGVPTLTMPSGAGHDAAVFASAGVPSAMVFVRNQNGSHNPDEDMRMDDFALGATLIARLVAE